MDSLLVRYVCVCVCGWLGGGGHIFFFMGVGVTVFVGMWALIVLAVNGEAMEGCNMSNDCALSLRSGVLLHFICMLLPLLC